MKIKHIYNGLFLHINLDSCVTIKMLVCIIYNNDNMSLFDVLINQTKYVVCESKFGRSEYAGVVTICIL